jgi:hypothetical protein
MNAFGIALLVFLAPIFQQAPGTSVQGVILKAVSGEPIAGARVELIRVDGSAPQSYSTMTSGDGTFVIPNARPGQYRVAASRSGFLRREFGQRSRNGFGLALNLEASQHIRNLEIELRPSAAISGRVTDREGSPVATAEVRALVTAYSEGQKLFRVVQSTITNDLGEYRLFGLPAGPYFISVVPSVDAPVSTLVVGPSPTGGPVNAISGALARTRVVVYYPSTTDSRNATPIDLTTGGDFGGVNITLTSWTTHRIRGSVPGGTARVSLVPADPGLTTSVLQADASSGPFEFSAVAPGEYTLVARSGDLLGRTTVNLGDGDLDNVTIGLSPSVSVPTRVSFEDRTPGELDPELESVTLSLIADPVIPGAEPDTYSPFPNGRLAFGVLLRQDYRIALKRVQSPSQSSRLRDVYIKSIRFGTRDVMNGGMRIDDPENIPPLEIVLGLRAGTLSGTVVSEKQKPLPNATVVLIPDAERRRWPDSFLTVRTELSGRFTMGRIPPGDYIAFSWEEVEDGAWTDPEFVKKVEERGKRVHVNTGQNPSVSIIAIP